MLVVEKIVDFMFPVVDIPNDKAIRNELKEYFDKAEKENSKNLKVLIVMGLIVMIINFYILIQDNIVITNRIILIFPQTTLLLKGTYLMCRYMHEKNNLKAIIIKDNFVILFLLSFTIVFGNATLCIMATENIIIFDDNKIFNLIIAAQVYNFISYLIGYHMYYKKVVENLLRDSKAKKAVYNRSVSFTVMSSVSVYSIIRFRLISGNTLCLILCGLLGFILFKFAAIMANCRFYCKLYED